MNHQMYEKWAVTPETRSKEETESFETHCVECETCTILAANWNRIETMLSENTQITTPKPGFATRFMDTLPARKEAEQKRQVGKSLWILGFSFLAILSASLTYFYSTNSVKAILYQLLTLGAEFVILFENLKIVASTFVKFAPIQLMIPGFMVLGSAILGLLILWVITLWQYSLQGEPTHE